MDEFEEVDYDALDEEFAEGDSVLSDSARMDLEAQKRAEDPHFVEYYLKQIPKTPEEIQTCHDIIQEGLYNMGVILKDRLEDFGASITEFNTLLSRYPDNIYRLDAYYNLYLMYVRMGNMAMAETYRSLIINQFPESGYGQAMKDPKYLDNLRNMERDQEKMYADAYDAYLNNRNDEVHDAYAEMMRRYPLSKIMPKFMFIDALSYLTDKNYDKFKSTLRELLARYPETDITPTASSIMRQIAQGRKLEGGSTNVRGMFWSMRLSNDSVDYMDTTRRVTPFKLNLDAPQYYVLAFPRDSVSENQLLFDIAKHNFSSFEIKDFDLEQLSFGRMGLLVIKGFSNFDELTQYKTVLEADRQLSLPSSVKQIMISVENFDLLINEGRSWEEYFMFLEQENIKEKNELAGNVGDESQIMEDENGVGDMQQPDEETDTGEDANESGGDSEDAAVDYREE